MKRIVIVLAVVLLLAGCSGQDGSLKSDEEITEKPIDQASKTVVDISNSPKQNQTSNSIGFGPKHWYKAQLHTHSPCYGGWGNCQSGSPNWKAEFYEAQVTLADFIQFHKDAGYDIVAVSDYGIVTDTSEFRTGEFLTIPNSELTSVERHLNAIGVTRQPVLKNDDFQAGVDTIRAAGGIVQINHPNNPKQLTAQEIVALEPHTEPLLMEVLSSWGLGARNNWISVWDGVLSSGRQLYATGTSDWHGEANEINRAWIMVRAENLDYAKVMDALRNGEFYATTGPLINDIRFENKTKTLVIELPKANIITFFGSNERVLYSTTAASASYTLASNDLFVRAEIYDGNGRNGKMALTQAYFNK